MPLGAAEQKLALSGDRPARTAGRETTDSLAARRAATISLMRLPAQLGRGGRAELAPIAGILAVAAGVRLVGLGREAFWIDEVITFNRTGRPGLAELTDIAGTIHPPLYFLGVAQWRALVGGSEVAIRSYSVLWGLVAVIATMLFAREVGSNRRTMLWAGALAAVSPLAVYFAQEARMYAQASTLVAVSSWALLAWINRSGARAPAWPWAALYAVSVAAFLLTHYVGLVVVLAQGMAVAAVCRKRRDLRLFFGYGAATVAVTLLFLPWLRFVQTFRPSLYRAADLSWMPSPGWRDVVSMFTRDLVWGSPGLHGWGWPIAQGVSAGLAAAVVWVLWASRRRPDDSFSDATISTGHAFAAWMIVGPVVLALIISRLYHPVLWPPRFCNLILPPTIVLAASAIDAVRRRPLRWLLPSGMFVVCVVGLALQHSALTKGGMRDFARAWTTLGPPDAASFFPDWKRTVARYELGGPLPQITRRRLKRRLERGKPFTLWVCSTQNYDGIWRPEPERREREYALALGDGVDLGVVDHMDIVEIRVEPEPADSATD